MSATANRPPHRKRRGMRQEQLDFANSLRDRGMTWVEIAVAVRERFRVSALVAMRLAHGWSQRDVADMWNRSWPDDLKTFKNLSYWEQWPSATGYSPSLSVLGRLAELYSCAVTDLLADGPDFRRRDQHNQARAGFTATPVPHALTAGLDKVLSHLVESDVEEITGVGLLWADRLGDPRLSYGMLRKLSAGLALAASMYQRIPPEEDLLPAPEAGDEPPAEHHDDLVGIWRGSFETMGSMLSGDHHVLMRRNGRRLIGQSLPHPTGACIRFDLEEEGEVVYGTWVEHVRRRRRAHRCGTVRLILDREGRVMHGRWLALDERSRVRSGEWELDWVQEWLSGRDLTATRTAA